MLVLPPIHGYVCHIVKSCTL
uniref:Uncharacterized protein n=1 Tax=Rhizophora mucronata TaxID=61149 RepID=A0A2P2IXV8_RHIMU